MAVVQSPSTVLPSAVPRHATSHAGMGAHGAFAAMLDAEGPAPAGQPQGKVAGAGDVAEGVEAPPTGVQPDASAATSKAGTAGSGSADAPGKHGRKRKHDADHDADGGAGAAGGGDAAAAVVPGPMVSIAAAPAPSRPDATAKNAGAVAVVAEAGGEPRGGVPGVAGAAPVAKPDAGAAPVTEPDAGAPEAPATAGDAISKAGEMATASAASEKPIAAKGSAAKTSAADVSGTAATVQAPEDGAVGTPRARASSPPQGRSREQVVAAKPAEGSAPAVSAAATTAGSVPGTAEGQGVAPTNNTVDATSSARPGPPSAAPAAAPNPPAAAIARPDTLAANAAAASGPSQPVPISSDLPPPPVLAQPNSTTGSASKTAPGKSSAREDPAAPARVVDRHSDGPAALFDPTPATANALGAQASSDAGAAAGPISPLAASALQPSASAASAPAASAPVPSAPAIVAATVAQFSGVVAARAQAGGSAFDIRLDPPELGKVAVRLKIDRDGSVTSHFTVDSAEALGLLRGDLRSLQGALQQVGLRSDPGATSFQLRDGGAGQGGWQPPPGQQQGQPALPQPVRSLAPSTSTAGAPVAGYGRRQGAGALDLLI